MNTEKDLVRALAQGGVLSPRDMTVFYLKYLSENMPEFDHTNASKIEEAAEWILKDLGIEYTENILYSGILEFKWEVSGGPVYKVGEGLAEILMNLKREAFAGMTAADLVIPHGCIRIELPPQARLLDQPGRQYVTIAEFDMSDQNLGYTFAPFEDSEGAPVFGERQECTKKLVFLAEAAAPGGGGKVLTPVLIPLADSTPIVDAINAFSLVAVGRALNVFDGFKQRPNGEAIVSSQDYGHDPELLSRQEVVIRVCLLCIGAILYVTSANAEVTKTIVQGLGRAKKLVSRLRKRKKDQRKLMKAEKKLTKLLTKRYYILGESIPVPSSSGKDTKKSRRAHYRTPHFSSRWKLEENVPRGENGELKYVRKKVSEKTGKDLHLVRTFVQGSWVGTKPEGAKVPVRHLE